MNADDAFSNDNVLENTDLSIYDSYVLVYGNTTLENNIAQYPTDISKGLKIGKMIVCHQAMLFNKNILKDNLKYSTKYKVSGDYELIVKLFLNYQN